MKNIIGINGSPRKNGNTEILLTEALRGAREAGASTESIVLNDLTFVPCQEEEYAQVDSDGFSVIKDDMHLVFDKIKRAHAIIMASPIFFGSLSAQSKMMIDRFQCVWVSKFLMDREIFARRKKGALILVQASHKREFFENAKFIARQFFHTINVSWEKELFCPGFDEKGKILDSPPSLSKAFQLGKHMGKIT
jgi:multimeric flavodoxin WrbA